MQEDHPEEDVTGARAHDAAAGPSWAPGYWHRTSGEEPIAFQFRVQPEDFRVTELPLRSPSGAGGHAWLHIEKTGLGTPELVDRLCRLLGCAPDAVGFAGRKDARAVTTQWISVEHAGEPRVIEEALAGQASFRLLECSQDGGKLRLGELRGNRFELVLRDLAPGDGARCEALLGRLVEEGVPNYYGSQRFGLHGETWQLGDALVRGQHERYVKLRVSAEHALQGERRDELEKVVLHGSRSEQRALSRLAPGLEPELAMIARQLARRPRNWDWVVRALPRRLRSFHVSALQARLFNQVLARRQPGRGELLEGDRLVPVWPGDPRSADGAAESSRRFGRSGLLVGEQELRGRAAATDRLELSPSGPLPGHAVPLAEGRPGEVERQVLREARLPLDGSFPDLQGLRPRGARRALLARIEGLEVGPGPGAGTLRVAFSLPPGSFATTVLEELRKDHLAAPPTQEAPPGGVQRAPERDPGGFER